MIPTECNICSTSDRKDGNSLMTLATSAAYPHPMCGYRYQQPVLENYEEVVLQLADSLRGEVLEGCRIHDVATSDEWDGERDAEWLEVTLLMDDPPAGEPIWPRDRRYAIDEAVRDRAYDMGILERVSLRHIHLSDAAVFRALVKTGRTHQAARDRKSR